MLKTRIDRFLVRKAMRGRYSTFGELAKAASISTTTMTKATDSNEWRSSTLDAIADALGVSPLTLLAVEEVAAVRQAHRPLPEPAEGPATKASDATRQAQRNRLTPPGAQATPALLAAEAERRAALLEQAAGRGKPCA